MRAPAFSVAVTVTVAAPPPSATLAGSRLSATAVDAVSLSVIVSVAVAPVRSVALARRISVSGPSAALSSVGVNVSVAVPLVSLAAIVTVNWLTAW